jgi:hypothetical protein
MKNGLYSPISKKNIVPAQGLSGGGFGYSANKK